MTSSLPPIQPAPQPVVRPAGPPPSESERQADLLDRHLSTSPVVGVDRADLVARVRRGEAGSVKGEAGRLAEAMAKRQAKAALNRTLGGPFLAAGALSPLAGLVSGGWYGSQRFGVLGAVGGALLGGLGGVLVGFGLGKLGAGIYNRVKPPTEEEEQARQRLGQVGERLEAGPGRTEAERAAARAAAEAARSQGHPETRPTTPGQGPDADDLKDALFGGGELKPGLAFHLPPNPVLAGSVTKEGLVVCQSDWNRLVGVDARSGREAWSQALPEGFVQGSGLHATPVLSGDGRVAVGGGDGQVRLYEAATGAELGSWKSGSGTPTPAFGADGRLYVTEWKPGKLACLEPGRPDPLWVASMDPDSYGRLVPGPAGTVYEVGGASPFKARVPETGELRWQAPRGEVLVGTPLVAPDGTLIGTTGLGGVTAFDPDYGLALWKAAPKDGSGRPDLALSADGTAVLLSSPDLPLLEARNVADGTARWSTRLEGRPTAGPVAAPEGILVIGDSTGRVHLVHPDTGLVLKTAKLEEPARDLVPLPGGQVLAVAAGGQAWVLGPAPTDENPQDPGTIEPGQDWVIIGGIKVPVKR